MQVLSVRPQVYIQEELARSAPLASLCLLSCQSSILLEEMAVQQGSCYMVITFGSVFESSLLNTPPGEISGEKKKRERESTQLILAQYIVKGSELLHIHEKVAKGIFQRGRPECHTVGGSIHRHLRCFSGRKS